MGDIGFGGYGNVGSAGGQQRDAAQRLANQAWDNSAHGRNQQIAAEAPLYSFAMGQAPTAADYTAAAQRDANQAAAQSLGASARGGNVGLAQYQAGNHAAMANQAAAAQATQANLAAQQGWWNQYLQNLHGQRGQDIQSMQAQLALAGQAQAGLTSMYAASQQSKLAGLGAILGAGGAALGAGLPLVAAGAGQGPPG